VWGVGRINKIISYLLTPDDRLLTPDDRLLITGDKGKKRRENGPFSVVSRQKLF
jgi:hypothetical protein